MFEYRSTPENVMWHCKMAERITVEQLLKILDNDDEFTRVEGQEEDFEGVCGYLLEASLSGF